MIQLISLFKVMQFLYNTDCSSCRHILHYVVTSLPSDVMAVQDGPTSIRVSWSPSSDATGYRINYNSFGGSGNVTVSGGSTYEYRVTGLRNGEFYTISIVATSQYFPSNVLTVAGYIGLGKIVLKHIILL